MTQDITALIERLRVPQRADSIVMLLHEAADVLERLTQPVGVEPVGVFREDDDIGHVDLIPHQQVVLKDGTKLYSAETVTRLIAERDEERENIAVLLECSDTLQSQVKLLRSTLKDFRDGWDCDGDAHRYGTECRKCAASEALAATEPKEKTE